MTKAPEHPALRPFLKKSRGAAVAFALGAMIAAPPLVWAQNPPSPSSEHAAPVLAQQQSFAPLVKKVLPAVGNISVAEKSNNQGLTQRAPGGVRGPPIDGLLRPLFV